MAHGENAKANANKGGHDFGDRHPRSKKPGSDKSHKQETHRRKRHSDKQELKRKYGF